MSLRTVVAVAAMTCVALAGAEAHAQRFEGIITMKLSGGLNAVMSAGRGGSGPGGGGRGGTGRGGTDRGGAAGDAGSRGAVRSVPPRGGDVRAGAPRGGAGTGSDLPNDPRAEAMRSAMSGGLQQVEYMTRRGKVRIAIGAGNGGAPAAAMIFAPEDGLMYTLFPALSMYAEVPLAELNAQARADTALPPTGRSAPRPPVITHTKQFELIAGHRCEHVTVTRAGMKTDVCLGKGLGAFVMPIGAGPDAWNQVMGQENGFPLKVVDTDGQVIMEVTKIERKALAEALFTVPDTYTRMPEFGRRPPGQ